MTSNVGPLFTECLGDRFAQGAHGDDLHPFGHWLARGATSRGRDDRCRKSVSCRLTESSSEARDAPKLTEEPDLTDDQVCGVEEYVPSEDCTQVATCVMPAEM